MGAQGQDEYVPRELLTVVPNPIGPVLLPDLSGISEQKRYTVVLVLYIDEQGVVRRAEVEGATAPAPMEDAARNTFLAARFSPGEIQGTVVRSKIRVEVTFDNTPLYASIATGL